MIDEAPQTDIIAVQRVYYSQQYNFICEFLLRWFELHWLMIASYKTNGWLS